MKKFFLSLLVVLGFSFYAAYERGVFGKENTLDDNLPPIQAPTYQTPQAQINYKDGRYTGPVTDAFYGPFQVRAIIKNGKLADIEFLKYPDDRPTSIRINVQAIPYMKQEAIAAQSADVDIITGATQSVEAFQKSLDAALAQAR